MIKPEKQLTMPTPMAQGPQFKVPLRFRDRRRVTIYLTLLALAYLTLTTLPTMVPEQLDLLAASQTFLQNIQIMFFHPALSNTTFVQLLQALLESVLLALLTTMLGAIIAFGLAVISFRQFVPAWIGLGIQSFMALIRAIPNVLWVLIYSVVFGLGANAAVIGLTFHSVAYLTKVYTDSMDELAPDAIETMRAMGLKNGPIIRQALIPNFIPSFLSWTFIRFEINFADAVAVGAAAGAGGIGYQLFMSSSFYFNFHEVGVIVYLILVFAILLEIASYQLRKRVMGNQ
ncbi:ABC transporter permease [Secundilactobacillus paracollinoides]|uniref:ABC transporter permease n=1 Tax=Secundilactobacillus paracollinoides TaxID=240427 RepID=A0A1B2IWE9_9LACO|nr:ABC transporter permease subunit [Secundilactobacillus paracollinoides]ANZ60613.1 ABC transporter permease [Secundilactobacillus paracollinoides]ANZ64878.1 ABC transporter permease [Secundilactobacillus paracollinoides]ANZ66394.1 ABC transporter permease [Secundilactobacillus paracollinoides]